jgi:mannose-1-phosphate guanylyltransferase
MSGSPSVPVNLRAMVLAAGFGTRLRPLTDILPKPLVPLLNRPLVAYTLDLLSRAGVERVALNLHHLGEKIESALGDGSDFGVRILYSHEEEILGTGGGVMRMRSFLDGDTFLLINGDILTNVDIGQLVQYHRGRRAAATMVVRSLPGDCGYTPLGMDEDGRLVHFKQVRIQGRGQIRPVMFCGVHALEPQVFDFLPATGFACINDQAYVAMIKQGLQVAAFLDEGPWFDLGTPPAYLEANLAILSGAAHLTQVELPRHAGREDSLLVGKNVHMGKGAQLGPLVIVGDGCSIGRGARLSNCVLWPGSSVEAGASHQRAVIAGKTVVSANRN